ncbi:MAG: type VI secretion system protein ImpK [Pseudohongiellaceae bacterium]|jgi:type VI secretion system protein ImpK
MNPNNGNKTVIIPTPGRKSSPAGDTSNFVAPTPQREGAAPANLQKGHGAHTNIATELNVTRSLNKLVGAATELIALVGELRHTIQHTDPSKLRNSIIDQMREFETDAKQDGQASEVVLSARYVLCAALDEAVLNTPWGPESGWAQHSLLSTFHNETSGGEKVFLILDRLLQTPAQYIDTLELIYLCLSQGFSGKYQIDPRGHLQLEQIKENLYRAIEMQRGIHERELSPRWKGAEKSNKKVSDFVPLWVVFTIALSLVVLSYSGFRVWLDHTATPIAEELNLMTIEYNKDAKL